METCLEYSKEATTKIIYFPRMNRAGDGGGGGGGGWGQFRWFLLLLLLALVRRDGRSNTASAFVSPTPRRKWQHPVDAARIHPRSGRNNSFMLAATLGWTRDKEDTEQSERQQRQKERQRTLTKLRRWKSYRERTMDSMARCYRRLCLSAVLDVLVQGIEVQTSSRSSARGVVDHLLGRPGSSITTITTMSWIWNTHTLWWLLDTVWKVALGAGMWRVHTSFRYWGLRSGNDDDDDDDRGRDADETANSPIPLPFSEPPPTSIEERIEESLSVLAFLWRQTTWVLLAGALLDLVALFGWKKWTWLVMVAGSMAFGSWGTRQFHHSQTRMFLARNQKHSTLRIVGLRTVRNMALCSYALVVQGLVKSLMCVARSAAAGNSARVAFPTTPFWAATMLWTMRRAFFRTVVVNSSIDDNDSVDFLLVNQDLLQAQDTFYGTVSTAITSEVLAKVAWLLVGVVRSIMDPAVLEALASRSF